MDRRKFLKGTLAAGLLGAARAALPRLARLAPLAGRALPWVAGSAAGAVGATLADRGPDFFGQLVILLDPGHGGDDRWKRGPSGYVEADGTLSISWHARRELEAAGVKVYMTRQGDDSVSLKQRTDRANDLKPDLFLSVHTNGWGMSGVAQQVARGTETFAQIRSSTSRAAGRAIHAALMAELNQAVRGTPLQPWRDRGLKIWQSILPVTGGRQFREDAATAPADGTDYLHILRESRPPTVLTEIAFHDYPGEEALLKTDAFRARAGRAIARGIVDWARAAGRYTPGPFGYLELYRSGRRLGRLTGWLIESTLHVDAGMMELITGRFLPVQANVADLVAIRPVVEAAWPGAKIQWQAQAKTAIVTLPDNLPA